MLQARREASSFCRALSTRSVVGHERIADGGLADVADDARGDVLVGHLAPGRCETRLAEARLVQLQRQLAQLLAGQLARAREHGDEGRNGVAAGPDEVGELLQVVLRPLRLPVAALGAEQPVVVMRDEHRLRVTFALAVENLTEVGVLGEPGGDVGERHALQLLDEGIGRHAGAGLEVTCGGFAQVAFLALELGDELVARQGALCVARDLHELARELGEGDGRVDHYGLHGGQACRAS